MMCWKRQIARLLVLALMLGLFISTPVLAVSYEDTKDHWAESSIERWSDCGIVNGNEGLFLPDDSITRGEMAKTISELLGLTKTTDNPFSDVAEDAWYAPYVLRCYAAGIMVGYDGRASPTYPTTRQEAVVMLCRALSIAEGTEQDLDAFNDV